jgi:hypothetical protein
MIGGEKGKVVISRGAISQNTGQHSRAAVKLCSLYLDKLKYFQNKVNKKIMITKP